MPARAEGMPGRRPGRLLRAVLRAPLLLYRARLGVLLGHRFLQLTHAGRRTGRHHRTVVEVVGHSRESGEFFVMSGFGRSSDWYRNVLAGGAREIAVGGRRFAPATREVGGSEAADVLRRYELRNRLIAPVVRRVLSRLVGWSYTGSDEDRRRLVAELPVIAFRPEGTSD